MIWILYILGWYAIGVISLLITALITALLDKKQIVKENVGLSFFCGVMGPLMIIIIVILIITYSFEDFEDSSKIILPQYKKELLEKKIIKQQINSRYEILDL